MSESLLIGCSDDNFPVDSQQYEQLNSLNALDLLSKMHVMDPRHRTTVDEAMKYPYISLWFKDDKVDGPPPATYDDSTEADELIVQQWKQLIYDNV